MTVKNKEEFKMIKKFESIKVSRSNNETAAMLTGSFEGMTISLYANQEIIIPPGTTEQIKTDVKLSLPDKKEYDLTFKPNFNLIKYTSLRVPTGAIKENEVVLLVDNIHDVEHDVYVDYTSAGLEEKLDKVRDINGLPHEAHCLHSKGTYVIRKGDYLADLVVRKNADSHVYL